MPLHSTTPSQRYETAMSVFRPVASVLSQLCESDFHCAMKWLYAIEKQVRSGDWKQSMQFADGGTRSDTGDDDSPIQSPIHAQSQSVAQLQPVNQQPPSTEAPSQQLQPLEPQSSPV